MDGESDIYDGPSSKLVDVADREYKKMPKPEPITVADSARFSNKN